MLSLLRPTVFVIAQTFFVGAAVAKCDQELAAYCSAQVPQRSDCVQANSENFQKLKRSDIDFWIGDTKTGLEISGRPDYHYVEYRAKLRLLNCLAGTAGGDSKPKPKPATIAAPKPPTESVTATVPRPKDRDAPVPPDDKCRTMQRPAAANIAANRAYCECSGERRFSTTANGWRCTYNGGSAFYGCTRAASGWSCIAN